MTEYHTLIPASHLILIKDGKILLQRRFNTPYMNGMYNFVSGHVEQGETSAEAMIREAKEEVCISLSPSSLECVHICHRLSEGHQERIDFCFMAIEWSGELQIGEPEKCDDLDWFDLDELPDKTIPYIRWIIDQIRKEHFYSEFGW